MSKIGREKMFMNKMFGNRDRVKMVEPIAPSTEQPHIYKASPKDAKVPISPSTEQPHSYKASLKDAKVPISPSTKQPHVYKASLKNAKVPISPSTEQPHSYKASLKDAKVPISSSTEQPRSDVFLKSKNLNNGHIKSWVDDKNSNCFMLFPRNLSITWSDDPNYWTWFPNKESPNEAGIEFAALKNVCWLDITGKFDTKNLTPGITYEVVFKLKLEDPAYGWDSPVNIKLVLPSGYKSHEQKVSLREVPRYQWVDIRVGEFKPEKNSGGEISFSMYEHETGVWKKGLFLKGVEIRPKYKN